MSELKNITELPVAESTEGAMLTGHVDGRAVQIPMNKIGQVKVYEENLKTPDGGYIDPNGEFFSVNDLEKVKQLINDFKTGIVIIENRYPDDEEGLLPLIVTSLMVGYSVKTQPYEGKLANVLFIHTIAMDDGSIDIMPLTRIPYDFFD